MKKVITSIFISTSLLFTACSDFLNVSDELASNLSIEEVFENVGYTKRWHSNIFNCIPDYSSLFYVDGMKNPWPHLCGETTCSYAAARTEMENGFNASNASYHRFTPLYQVIREAHIFLEKAHSIGNKNDKQVLTEEEIKRMKSEAKFFIAYSYFSLFELYGPVPLITEIANLSQPLIIQELLLMK